MNDQNKTPAESSAPALSVVPGSTSFMIPQQPPIDNEFVAPGCELFSSCPPPARLLEDHDLPTTIAERYAWMFGKNIEWRDLESAALRKVISERLGNSVADAARRLVGVGEWNDGAVNTITEEVVTAILGKSNIPDQPTRESAERKHE